MQNRIKGKARWRKAYLSQRVWDFIERDMKNFTNSIINKQLFL
jgi:hypothetical protein